MLKVLHQLSAIGVMGALACCVVLVIVAPKDSLVEYAALRQGIAAITRWLLVPSLLLVLVTGLLALAASSGRGDPVALEPLLRTEWAGLWTMLVLSLANVLLAVWRPRIRRGR